MKEVINWFLMQREIEVLGMDQYVRQGFQKGNRHFMYCW